MRDRDIIFPVNGEAQIPFWYEEHLPRFYPEFTNPSYVSNKIYASFTELVKPTVENDKSK